MQSTRPRQRFVWLASSVTSNPLVLQTAEQRFGHIGMKRIELWRWRYFDMTRGQMVTTGCVFSVDNALSQWPDAVPVPGTRQMREIPDIDDEAGETIGTKAEP